MKRFLGCFIFLTVITFSFASAADSGSENFSSSQNYNNTREVKTGFLNFLKRILFGTDDLGDSQELDITPLNNPETNKPDIISNFSRLLNDADRQINEVDKRLYYLSKNLNKTNLNNISEVLNKFNLKLTDLKSLSVSLRAQLTSSDFNYDNALSSLKDNLLVDLMDFRSDLFVLENVENYLKLIKGLDKDLIRFQTKLDFLIKQKKDTKQAEALFKDLSSKLEDFKDYISTSNELDYQVIFNFESSLERNKFALSDELFMLQGYIKKDDLSRMGKSARNNTRAFKPSNLSALILRILYR